MGNARLHSVFQQIDGGSGAAAQQEQVTPFFNFAVEQAVPCRDDSGDGAALDQRQQLLIFRTVC